MAEDRRLLSLVVPVLNEEEVLAGTYRTLTAVLTGLERPYEVLLVDNGSTDSTPEIAAQLCRTDPRWCYMRLSRNFGYQNSITAGMLAARGEAIMVIDADLQDPPELIPEFIRLWEAGHDVVYGIRVRRTGESRWRTWPTMAALRLITWMSDGVKLPAHSGDFRLISRRVRDALASMPETNRYTRGIIHWLGFRQLGIPYTRRGRTGGRSKFNLSALIGVTLNAIVGYSFKPIRLFSLVGVSTLTLAMLLALTWALGAGWLSGVHLLLLLNLGVLSLGIGVLGEYVGKIHTESKRRPLYFLDYTINLDPAALAHPIDAATSGEPVLMLRRDPLLADSENSRAA